MEEYLDKRCKSLGWMTYGCRVTLDGVRLRHDLSTQIRIHPDIVFIVQLGPSPKFKVKI